MARRFSVEAVFKAVDKMTAPVRSMTRSVGSFTRKTERGLRRTNRRLNSFIGSIKRAAGAVTRFAAIGIGGAATGVGLLVREFSKIENAQAAFTPLLGGADRAREAVDALNKTAATTPFQFETLAKSANQLLPVMDGNIERTIETIRRLGDTAGGNAQKLDSITRGFTKAMLKGRVDMESLNMIAEAGVPIFDDLAAVMGVEVNQAFFKMISAGKVTTDQLDKAFQRMTSEGGKFHKGMQIASKTTTGLFSTLKDNISLTAAEIGSALAPSIKGLIKDATKVAKRVRKWAKENKDLINEKFTKFIDTIKNGFSTLVERSQDIIKWIKRIGIALGVIIGLSSVLKTFIGIMTLVNLVMAANPVGLIISGFVAMGAAITAVIVFWDDIVDAVNNFADTVNQTFDSLPLVIKGLVLPIKIVINAFRDLINVVDDLLGRKDPLDDLVVGAKSLLGFENPLGTEGIQLVERPERDNADNVPAASTQIQTSSPQARATTLVEERRRTEQQEIIITDKTGNQFEVFGGNVTTGGIKLNKSGSM